MNINLGCGEEYKKGWVNVDFYGKCDISHNLNVFPYPFENECADKIMIKGTIEHLDNAGLVIKECYRILKHGGLLIANLPTQSCDIFHKIFKFDDRYFKQITVKEKSFQSGILFNLERVYYSNPKKFIGFKLIDIFKLFIRKIKMTWFVSVNFELVKK